MLNISNLSMLIALGTLVVSFYNAFQVHDLNIQFHKKSKVYDKKFEVLLELENLSTMNYVCLKKILSIFSYFPDAKKSKYIDDFSSFIDEFHLKVRLNKKLLINTNIEDELLKTSGEALVNILLFISGNKEDISQRQFLLNLNKNIQDMDIICDKLLTKYHNLKNN